MTKEELTKLADVIREGKATDEEKLRFLRDLNVNLREVSELLKSAPKKSK